LAEALAMTDQGEKAWNWQDVRLIAGEGKLSLQAVLDACNALRRQERRPPPVGGLDGEDEVLRFSIEQAYEAGCKAVHENFRPDPDPEFGEAATDYAFSVLPSVLAALAQPPAQPDVRELVEAARRVHAAMCPGGEADGFTYDKSSAEHQRYCDRIASAALASYRSKTGEGEAG
jgi:hypothetical protein